MRREGGRREGGRGGGREGEGGSEETRDGREGGWGKGRDKVKSIDFVEISYLPGMLSHTYMYVQYILGMPIVPVPPPHTKAQ